jgi:hypothetical protein
MQGMGSLDLLVSCASHEPSDLALPSWVAKFRQDGIPYTLMSTSDICTQRLGENASEIPPMSFGEYSDKVLRVTGVFVDEIGAVSIGGKNETLDMQTFRGWEEIYQDLLHQGMIPYSIRKPRAFE